MAEVIDSAHGESVLGQVHGCELQEPAGFSGVPVHHAHDAFEWGLLLNGGPPLGEELEVLLAGDVSRTVVDRVARVELLRRQRAEGARLVGFVYRVSVFHFSLWARMRRGSLKRD